MTEDIEDREKEMNNLAEKNKLLKEDVKKLNLEAFGYLDEIDDLKITIQCLKESIRSHNSLQNEINRKRYRRN